MTSKTILLVDDDTRVLSSLSRLLSENDFDNIQTAQNAMEALSAVQNTHNLAVVLSDYKMPGMNGIELLALIRKSHPDITRILLTGMADLDMAIEAINQGNLFRFLVKPCSEQVLIGAIVDGLRQNELITSEKELLSKTLSGSIKVMIDILAVLSPTIFTQAGRLRNYARDLAIALNREHESWEIELAALLSQIGAVTVPRPILEKWQNGEMLEESEAKLIRSIPHTGKMLIKNIPRMENIANAVGFQNCTFSGMISLDAPTGDNIPFLARILKVIVDYDRLAIRAKNPSVAFQTMLIREAEYDPSLLVTFRHKVLRLDTEASYQMMSSYRGEKAVLITGLRMGMVLSRDVIDKNGTLVVAKGTPISDVLYYKLINYFRSQAVAETVYIESEF